MQDLLGFSEQVNDDEDGDESEAEEEEEEEEEEESADKGKTKVSGRGGGQPNRPIELTGTLQKDKKSKAAIEQVTVTMGMVHNWEASVEVWPT